MNKTVLLVLMIVVASVTGGCSFLGNAKKDFDEAANKPIPNVNGSQTPGKVTEAEIEEEFADLAEEDAELAEAEAKQAVAGLIPATNSDIRVRSSVRGRQDPFSVVTLVPKIEIEEEEEQIQPVVNNRTNRTNRTQNRVAQRNNRNDRLPNPTGGSNAQLAQSVVISGLYESNGRTKLIVKAPEEDNSRYVEVGQYLSNGQILVKSIDRNYFPTPRVILEQSGVEVAKTIGETPEDSRNRVSSLPEQNNNSQALISNISLNLEEIQ